MGGRSKSESLKYCNLLNYVHLSRNRLPLADEVMHKAVVAEKKIIMVEFIIYQVPFSSTDI